MALPVELERDGYIHLQNALSPDEIEFARRCFVGENLNYTNMHRFIHDSMFGKLRQSLNWNPKSVKYRASNNNNSADASMIHRDLNCQAAELKIIPCFTVLSYLDTTTVELIPGTHKKLAMSLGEAISKFGNGKMITINPGDLLIFYSTLLHRGIFTEKLENRRLIQVFDTFPTPELYNQYAKEILHARGDEDTSDMMIRLSKIKPIIMPLIFMGYTNAATGYGWSKNNNILQQCKLSDRFTHISSEGSRGRVSGEGIQQGNNYVLLEKTDDFPESCYSKYKHVCYTNHYIMYVLLLILIAYVIYQFVR